MGNYTWTGNAGDYQWSTADNWDPNGTPGSDSQDIAAIYGASTVVEIGQSEAITINQLTLGGELDLAGSFYANTVSVTPTGFIGDDGTLETGYNLINGGLIAVGGSWAVDQTVLSGAGVVMLEGGTVDGGRLYEGNLENSGSTIEGYGAFVSTYAFGQTIPLNLQNDPNSKIIARDGTLDLRNGSTITNGGLLGAAFGWLSAGRLLLENDVQNTLDTRNGTALGTIQANGAGNIVDLDNMTVTGGLVEATGGGLIQVGDGTSAASTATLSLVTLAAGQLEIGNRHELDLTGGGIVDNGKITVDGGQIDIEGGGDLAGHGRIQLAPSSSKYGVILGTAGTTLSNELLIDGGSGAIDSNADVTLMNHGRIICDVAGGEMGLSLGSGSNSNDGTFEATNGGALYIGAQGTSATLDNTGLVAALANSTLSVNANTTLTNISKGGVLSGGTWEASGAKATLNIGEAFTYDAATIVLSGTGSVINDGSTTLEAALKGVSTGGKLEVLGSRSYTTSNAFAIRGTLQLAGTGTFKAGSISAASGSLIEGSGTIAGSVLDNASIAANGGKLAFTGAVTGLNTATITKGATLAFAAGATSTVSFGAGGGRLGLQDAPQFTGRIANLGAGDTLDVAHLGAGTTFTYAANSTNTGGTLTLKNGSTTDKLTLVGSYVASGFKLATGGSGDTLVTYATPAKEAPGAAPSHATSSADLAQSLFDAALGGHGVAEARVWVLTPTASEHLHPVLAPTRC